MAREDLHRIERQVSVERRAGVGEDLVEDPAHGEHGRPGVDPLVADRDLAQLAARGRGPLQHDDIEPARGEQDRGGEPADPGPDHRDALAPGTAGLRNADAT